MLRGLTERLEQHHQVRILDEAIVGAVTLSQRYVMGRQLPDKAVSVLDTACARVAISQAATPPSIEDAQRRIAQCTVEIGALAREAVTGTDHVTRLAALQRPGPLRRPSCSTYKRSGTPNANCSARSRLSIVS
jgi:type VI secretion system protein VasG